MNEPEFSDKIGKLVDCEDVEYDLVVDDSDADLQ